MSHSEPISERRFSLAACKLFRSANADDPAQPDQQRPVPWAQRVRRRLARETSPGRRFIPEIDGLRFIAIMGVLLYHLHDQARQTYPALTGWSVHAGWGFHAFQRGHIGVELFFVISGFILALPFARHHLGAGRPVRLGEYYLRRLSRLEPTYLINLTLFSGTRVAPRRSRCRLGGPVGGKLYLSAQHRLRRDEPNQFCRLVARGGGPILCARATVGVVVGDTLGHRSTGGVDCFSNRCRRGQSCPGHRVGRGDASDAIAFLAGFLLADLYVVRWSDRDRRSLLADALCIAAFASLFVLPDSSTMRFVFAPAMALIVFGGLRGRMVGWFVSRPSVVTIGGMCYTIYLYHFLILTGVGRITRTIILPGGVGVNFALQVALVIPIVLASSALLFVLFEKPFMRPKWYRALRPAEPPQQVNHVS